MRSWKIEWLEGPLKDHHLRMAKIVVARAPRAAVRDSRGLRARQSTRRAPRHHPHHRTRPTTSSSSSSTTASVSVDRLDEIEERACVDMANRLQAAELSVPGHGGPVKMTFVGPDGQVAGDKPVLVLLHGFDSSCLEFRRLFPLLEADFEVYALTFWGGGSPTAGGRTAARNTSPELWWSSWTRLWAGATGNAPGRQLSGRHRHRLGGRQADLVSKLVLVDAQGFQDGIGALQYLPEFLTKFFLEVLRSVPLRNAEQDVLL